LKPVKQAKRYAKALLRNVGMENAPQALTELISVNDLMVRSKEFRSLLINPRFTTEEKTGVIRTISERLKLSESTLKFVLHQNCNQFVPRKEKEGQGRCDDSDCYKQRP
jgi:F0F1-type ATP synthase delta subunit